MENENLLIFEDPRFGQQRSIMIDGEPWFVAADVCRALQIGNPTMALTRLDEDEKALSNIEGLSRGNDKGNIVSEAGLYSLILRSRKPEAKAFKRWITHEVIPSIRKYGAYVTDKVLDQMDEHPELIPEYIQRLRDENANARTAREALEKAQAENALLAPKATYYDSFVGIDSLTNIRYTAKELCIPQKKFIGYLLEKGYLFRDHHRKDRLFARAGERNNPLFQTKDFYLPDGTKSEYTLVTPDGKAHFLKRREKILAWVPRESEEGEEITDQAVYADDPVKPEEPR
ncbi:MAG: phage antirepressor KilAC domain-containing protein [Clostridia bacterium]|nr:phage antirepressor KilAC domain-containing protein [Clostridia bacterium]